jgi:dolichol-phosphate mannosyltransferase
MKINLLEQSRSPVLSVIIPVYNERDTIAATIALVRNVPIDKQIIVVDDGSTDGSQEILKSLAGPDLTLVLQSPNAGKGSAIRAGIPHIQGQVVIIQDADAEYDPSQYPQLIAPILEGRADVVYGSRFLVAAGNGKHRLQWPEGMKFPNWFINRLLAFMANVLYRAHLTDEATCYKVFRADILKSIPLSCERFEFCPEVTAKVRRRNIAIVEVPIAYYGRSIKQGKKINWRDGIEAIWTLIKYRFGE